MVGAGAAQTLLLLVAATAVLCGGWASADRVVGETRGPKLLAAPQTKTTTTFATSGSWGFAYTRSRGRCSPQFWSSRKEEWPTMVPLTSSVAKIFGSQAMERYGPELTLMEAAERSVDSSGDDAYARLLKQSTAALLNSYSRSGYPYSAWEVKTLFLQALLSEEAASNVANTLATANRACS